MLTWQSPSAMISHRSSLLSTWSPRLGNTIAFFFMDFYLAVYAYAVNIFCLHLSSCNTIASYGIPTSLSYWLHWKYLVSFHQRFTLHIFLTLFWKAWVPDLDLLELCRMRFDLVYCYKVFTHPRLFNPGKLFRPACSRSQLPYSLEPINATNLFLLSFEACNALLAALHSSSFLLAFMCCPKQVDLPNFLKGLASCQCI